MPAVTLALASMGQAQSVTVTGEVMPGGATSPDWNTGTNHIVMSNLGGAASLTISGGGTVDTSGGAGMGDIVHGPGVVLVTGAGSWWKSYNFFQMGAGSSVTLTAGGKLSANSMNVMDGTLDVTAGGVLDAVGFSQKAGTTVNLTGTGSRIGGNAALNEVATIDGTLNVSGGALFLTEDIEVGNEGDGAVTVRDAGTRFGSVGTDIRIMAGTSLDVGQGAEVKSRFLTLGQSGGSSDAAHVTVDTGATLEVQDELNIGYGSAQSFLAVQGGGYLKADTAVFVAPVLAAGHLLVTGAGSQADVAGFGIGVEAQATGHVVVYDGARVNIAGGSIIRQGYFDVTGSGSQVVSTANLELAGFSAASSSLNLSEGGTMSMGVVTLTRGTLNLGTGGAAGTLTGAVVQGNGTANSLVNFNHTDAMVFGSALQGEMTVTKAGVGALTITGANLNTGVTLINAGTLLAHNLAGSALGTSVVTVGAGATLGGTGFLGGATTVAAGAHLAPGHSLGTLTFDNGLTLASGALLDFELGATSDLLRITGGNFHVADATFNFTTIFGYVPGDYTLIDWTGATAGGFTLADFGIDAVNTGTVADYLLWIDGSKLMLTASAAAIPEPSTYAVLAGMLALGMCGWRRWRVAQVRAL